MNLILYLCLMSSSIFLILLGKRTSVVPIHYCNGKLHVVKFTFSHFIFFVICFSLVLLCASRPFESTYDTQVYIDWLNEVKGTSTLSFSGRFRPGFELFSKIILAICRDNYRLYFAVIVIANCIVVFKAISNVNEYSGNSFILYVGIIGLYYNYIVLRSGLALSFTILAYSYLDKSKKKALVCLLIAVLFHETALIVLVAILLKRLLLPIKKNILYIVSALSVILYLTKSFDRLVFEFVLWIQPHLPAKWFHTYILYLDSTSYKYNISLYYLICFLLTIIIIYRYKDVNSKYDTFLVVNIIGQLFFSLFSTNTIVGRLWDYMVPATFIFLLPEVYNHRKNSRLIYTLTFLMGFGLYTRVIIARVPFYL